MNSAKLRYFVYLRKSTDERDRQVRSLPDQFAELNEVASKQKLTIVRTFEEKRTAKSPGRPVFTDMLRRIEAGEANAILAWHPDRLARNTIDGGQIIHMIDRGQIAMLTFANHWFEPTSQGKFALSMAFGLSKYFVDNLSENIRRGNRQKVANGLWPNMPPLGYLHDNQTKGIKFDPVRAPILKRLFERYAAGDITMSALRDLSESWGLRTRAGNPLTLGRFGTLLSHPIYIGMIRYKGELYPGIHEPLVSRRLFARIQRALKSRSKPRRTDKPVHPMRGLFRCGECGAMFTMETQKGIMYLRCTKKKGPCSQQYLRADEAELQMRWLVKRLAIDEDYANELVSFFERDAADNKTRSRQAQAIQSSLTEIEERIQRLNDAMLNGQVGSKEYAELKNPMVLSRHDLEQKRVESSNNLDHRLELLRSWIRGSTKAYSLMESSTMEEICHQVRNLGSNHQISDKRVSFVLPFFHLTVAWCGPFGIGVPIPARVNEPIEDDVLKGAGHAWLLEDAAALMPRLSYSPGCSLRLAPLQVPVHLGVWAKQRSGALQSHVSLSA